MYDGTYPYPDHNSNKGPKTYIWRNNSRKNWRLKEQFSTIPCRVETQQRLMSYASLDTNHTVLASSLHRTKLQKNRALNSGMGICLTIK